MKNIKFLVFITAFFMLSGCALFSKASKPADLEKIKSLSAQIDELANAKNILENRLAKEITDKQVKLEMAEKGLVITFVADILFDSGKAKLRTGSLEALNKVAKVLKENVPDLNVGIEGHTDNEPIVHSGWKSNWELSTARALSVLHYLVGEEGIEQKRFAVIGYSEFQPLAPNDTEEDKAKNRRVEVVILPRINKVKEDKIIEPQTEEMQDDEYLK